MEKKYEVSEYDLQDLLPVAMVFVVTGIGIAFGLNVISDVRSDFTTASAEYNATSDAIEGISKIPTKMPILATIVVAAIIIGILMRYLFVRYG